MANGSISFNTSAASKSNIPTCAATGSRNICSTGSRWTTHQNTTQRNNSTNLTGSPRNGSPTIPAKAKLRKARAELVTLEIDIVQCKSNCLALAGSKRDAKHVHERPAVGQTGKCIGLS